MSSKCEAKDSFNICIIGAGVIGLAICYEVARRVKGQSLRILLLEQESDFGKQVSSRNSEVIHAGIYYPNNSLKAELCVRGKKLLYSFCEEFHVPHNKIGKLIVARESETTELEKLKEQAANNGVDDLQLLDRAQLLKMEPSVKADAALYSPSTGIINSHSYMQKLLHLAQNNGAQFSPYSRVTNIEALSSGFLVDCRIDEQRNPQQYQFHCSHLINSAGLQAQSIAGTIDALDKRTIPPLYYCKGDYFDYSGKNPFKHLLYPMPEKNTVGLGIHATMDLSSQLRFGPDINYVDKLNYDIDPEKNELFAKYISKYFPEISAERLKPAYSGIRPKLAGAGEAAADFVIQGTADHGINGLTQLFGFESPGLTASLAIGEKVADSIISS